MLFPGLSLSSTCLLEGDHRPVEVQLPETGCLVPVKWYVNIGRQSAQLGTAVGD